MKRLQSRLLQCSVLLIITLFLAACGNNSTSSSTNFNSIQSVSPQAAAASTGTAVPNFQVSTGEETTFSLDDHQGDVVVLYFSFPG